MAWWIHRAPHGVRECGWIRSIRRVRTNVKHKNMPYPSNSSMVEINSRGTLRRCIPARRKMPFDSFRMSLSWGIKRVSNLTIVGKVHVKAPLPFSHRTKLFTQRQSAQQLSRSVDKTPPDAGNFVSTIQRRIGEYEPTAIGSRKRECFTRRRRNVFAWWIGKKSTLQDLVVTAKLLDGVGNLHVAQAFFEPPFYLD